MKRLTLALCALLAAACSSASPFQDPLHKPASMNAKPNVDRMTAVAAAQGRLIAVGPDGRILASEDSGRTWQQGSVPVSSDLVSVRLLDKQKAWAVGHDGVVLNTQDGGKTWSKQLDGLQAARIMQAYYESQAKNGKPLDAQLMADVKRAVEEGADKPFFDVLFLNENEGFVVGAFNLSFRTSDGGRTWVPLYDRTDNPRGLHLYGLAIANGALYLVGEQGLIRRWSREKESFEAIDSPHKSSLFGAIGRDSMLVVFGLSGNVFRSTNSGASWAKLETRTTAGITSGAFLPDGRAALTTATGGLLITDTAFGSVAEVRPAKPMAYASVVPAGVSDVALAGSAGIHIESIKRGSAKAE